MPVAEGVNLFPAVKELLVILIVVLTFFILLLSRTSIKLPLGSLFIFLLIFYDCYQIFVSPFDLSIIVDGIRLQIVFPFFSLAIILLSANKINNVIVPIKTILVIMLLQSFVVNMVALVEMMNPDLIKTPLATTHSALYSVENLRVASIMPNQIGLGIYESIIIIITASLSYFYRKNFNLLFYILIIADTVIILMTFSRNAYVLVCFTGMLFLVFVRLHLKVKEIIVFVTFIALGVIIYIVLADKYKDISYLFKNRIMTMSPDSIFDSTGRFIKFEYLLKNCILNDIDSILFGNGIGFGQKTFSFFNVIENGYLYILLEKGIVGLFLYIFIAMRFVFNALACWNNIKKQNRVLGFLFFGVLGIISISNTNSNAFIGFPHVFYYWMFFAYSEIYYRKIKLEKVKNSTQKMVVIPCNNNEI